MIRAPTYPILDDYQAYTTPVPDYRAYERVRALQTPPYPDPAGLLTSSSTLPTWPGNQTDADRKERMVEGDMVLLHEVWVNLAVQRNQPLAGDMSVYFLFLTKEVGRT